MLDGDKERMLEIKKAMESKEEIVKMKVDSATRFYFILADRIPMTPHQGISIFKKILDGSSAPINAYEFQSTPLNKRLLKIKHRTVWLEQILNEKQYSDYVELFMAQIEMVRFQVSTKR